MPTLLTTRMVARRGSRPAADRTENGLGFALFLLVNLALFMRPADFIPEFYGFELYQYLILACLAVSFPAVLARLMPERLERSPIDVCVILWLPFIVLSHLVASRVEDAWVGGFGYFKIIIYFLLLVSLITTPRRLQTFTDCLICFTTVMTILGILDFHKMIELPRPIAQAGQRIRIDTERMYGPGIFGDPNDVCIIIDASLLLLLGKLADKRRTAFRLLMLFSLAIFAYGFYLTGSRGGLLALLAGLAVFIRIKWGWGRLLFLGALGVPVLLLVLGGRQAAISAETDTGQGRIGLWVEGMIMIRHYPLFGVGMGLYEDHAGQVAHNSFMQAFAETGLVGGMLYLGMVALSVAGLYGLTLSRKQGTQRLTPVIVDADYRQIHPYLAGAVTACAAGMMTLTMNTLVTTYTFLGLASVFLAHAATQPPAPVRKFEAGLLVKLAVLSVVFLGGMFVFIRFAYRP